MSTFTTARHTQASSQERRTALDKDSFLFVSGVDHFKPKKNFLVNEAPFIRKSDTIRTRSSFHRELLVISMIFQMTPDFMLRQSFMLFKTVVLTVYWDNTWLHNKLLK